MRKIALAAVIGASLLGLAGAASAQTAYNDPDGRLTFDAPRGWTVERQRAPTQTMVLAFNASNDCYLIGIPNSRTVGSSPAGIVRATTTPIAPESWTNSANSIGDFFPGGSARVVSQSVDTTSGFWPIQRAELTNGTKSVFGALTLRPGFDLMAFCSSTGNASASTYDAIFNSLGNANDATWEATGAPAPALAPAPAPASAPAN